MSLSKILLGLFILGGIAVFLYEQRRAAKKQYIETWMDRGHINLEGLSEAEHKEVFAQLPAVGSPRHYPKPMDPPWTVYPDIEIYSIGWRMGSGEDYMIAYQPWLRELPQAEKAAYIAKHPEPEAWTGFYENVIGR